VIVSSLAVYINTSPAPEWCI